MARRFIVEWKPKFQQFSIFNVGPYGGKLGLITRVSKAELEEKYFLCAGCGFRAVHYYHKKDLDECVTLPGGKTCCVNSLGRLGLFRCAQCGKVEPISQAVYRDGSYKMFCRDCLVTAGWVECDRCHRFFRPGTHLNLFRDMHVCSNCLYTLSNPINSYHTMKNSGDFTKHFLDGENESDNLLMGYELEVDNGESRVDCALKLSEHFGTFFRYERDGSLNSGFEIISEPATLGYHMNTDFDFLRNTLRANGFSSHDAGTCGLHVHLNNKFFGNTIAQQDVNVAKLLFIFEKFWNELYKFSRRKDTHWCSRYTNNPDYVITHKNNYGRYYAVNLTNRYTVEIRLWRGTLNLNTLKATLKLSEKLAVKVKTCSKDQLNNMSFTDLFDDDPDICAYWESINGRRNSDSNDD